MPLKRKSFSLQKYNTFGINVKTKDFLVFTEEKEIPEYFNHEHDDAPFFILGEGSNVLFSRDFDGTIIHQGIKGVEIINEEGQYIYLNVGAGEHWDDLVEYVVSNEWGGLENLSYIPGTVGACPVQNIGAYGVEVKDVIHKVNGFDIQNNEWKSFTNEECRFSYRNSIFKSYLKNQFIITSVVFRLTKQKHRFVINYGTLPDELANYNTVQMATIREAVINIRKRKLPDPEQLGNAGSFFKNPVVPAHKAYEIQQSYQDMPVFDEPNDHKKIPAAWLIEKCGWKGYKSGDAGVHEHHPLILVNYGKASGRELLELAREIQQSITEHFGIELQFEVNVV